MTLNPQNAVVTTAGNRTLTVAEVIAGIITRTGPSGAFTDTLPGTAQLLAALRANTPFRVDYLNASAQTATIAIGDANTTLAYGAGMLSATTIATHQKCQLLFTPAGSPTSPTLTVTLLNRNTMV